ncbi:protein of unknown function [Candidatus Promineifilum breve]|uniref:Uncharacterized protein n=1 Tax=Candidatus Promineifilum breve TaxID=1806508 RepID=A0A161KCY0_9CHLR|nr:helix-turn-helix domain-containing protein [Candidatus Promineifilum breve]CUS05423.2 protein of unknown function [Candidatus Promineifilum breve]
MKAIDFFRALDDSDLDPYETRLLIRVWRRGQCWETLESIAESTGMSIGKASQARNRLEQIGWLIKSKIDGRKVYEVALPDVETASISEPEISPDESVISPHEENLHHMKPEFHHMKPEFHHMKPEFHQVGSLPLIGPKEVDPIKYIYAREGSAAPDDDDSDGEALQRAREAIAELIEFWEELTKRKPPSRKSDAFRDNWLKPFNDIWLTCGRNVDVAKAKVQAVRNDMLAQGLTILDPAKLPGHVQTMIDRELLPLTQRMNGNGNGHANFKNDPMAREAHNRAVLAQVAQEIESGEWSPWTI